MNLNASCFVFFCLKIIQHPQGGLGFIIDGGGWGEVKF